MNRKNQSDFMEFLSSKVKSFYEFADMASFVSSLLKASSYPFFVVDKTMKIQYMNPACLDFTGLTFEDTIGKVKCMKVFNSSFCEINCAIKQAMETRKAVIGKRVTVRDKFNKEHTIIVTASPLINTKGQVLGGFEVWRDALPDKELILRVNRFLDTLNDYCRDMESFLKIIAKEFRFNKSKKDKRWHDLLNGIEKRTKDLSNSSQSLLKSSCWDILNCPAERQVQCPAFPNHGDKCWEVDYTWCHGQMQGKACGKANECKNCLVFIKEKNS